MAKKGGRDYFGFGKVLSIIFAIIPVTALIFGFVLRLKDGKIVAALIRILFGWNIIWIADLVSIILKGRIVRLLNI